MTKFDFSNSKEYKIEKIRNSILYVWKLKIKSLFKLYYIIIWICYPKKCLVVYIGYQTSLKTNQIFLQNNSNKLMIMLFAFYFILSIIKPIIRLFMAMKKNKAIYLSISIKYAKKQNLVCNYYFYFLFLIKAFIIF